MYTSEGRIKKNKPALLLIILLWKASKLNMGWKWLWSITLIFRQLLLENDSKAGNQFFQKLIIKL